MDKQDEIHEAVARLRRLRAGETHESVYGSVFDYHKSIEDQKTLADAYIDEREHFEKLVAQMELSGSPWAAAANTGEAP